MTLKTLLRRSEAFPPYAPPAPGTPSVTAPPARGAAPKARNGFHQAAMRLRDGMLFAAAMLAVFRFFGGDLLSPRDAIASVNRRVDTLQQVVRGNSLARERGDERDKFIISTLCALAEDQHATTAQHLCTQLEQAEPTMGVQP